MNFSISPNIGGPLLGLKVFLSHSILWSEAYASCLSWRGKFLHTCHKLKVGSYPRVGKSSKCPLSLV